MASIMPALCDGGFGTSILGKNVPCLITRDILGRTCVVHAHARKFYFCTWQVLSRIAIACFVFA